MKQAIKTTRMITMGLFSLCTMGLSHVTYAGVANADPMEFKFVGKVENHPVFQLSLNNDGTEVYYIRIKDANNNVLYYEKIKATDVNYTKNYQLATDDSS